MAVIIYNILLTIYFH